MYDRIVRGQLNVAWIIIAHLKINRTKKESFQNMRSFGALQWLNRLSFNIVLIDYFFSFFQVLKSYQLQLCRSTSFMKNMKYETLNHYLEQINFGRSIETMYFSLSAFRFFQLSSQHYQNEDIVIVFEDERKNA